MTQNLNVCFRTQILNVYCKHILEKESIGICDKLSECINWHPLCCLGCASVNIFVQASTKQALKRNLKWLQDSWNFSIWWSRCNLNRCNTYIDGLTKCQKSGVLAHIWRGRDWEGYFEDKQAQWSQWSYIQNWQLVTTDKLVYTVLKVPISPF